MISAYRNNSAGSAYMKTMMMRLAKWNALVLAALVALPAFAQTTPPSPPPPAPKITVTPPVPPPPPVAPVAPPPTGESPRDIARRARQDARRALRDAERQVRDAERRAEEAERLLEEHDEAAEEAEAANQDDESNDNDGPDLDVGGSDREMVVVGEDLRVGAGQHVRSAVAVGGSVIIEAGGYVEDDVVAVGGDVHLEAGAYVNGDAVSIGGSINSDPGAVVGGSRVNLAPSAHFIGNVFKHDRGAAAWTFISLVASIIRILVLFALATLIVVLAPERVTVMRSFVAERPFVSALAGIAALVAIIPMCILLVVTIIGIPLAPVAVVAFLVMLILGFTVVAVWIGERLPLFKNKKTMFAALALGFVILTLVDTLLPVFGTIVVFMASLVGAGAVLLSRCGQLRTGAAGAPPPPSPGTAMTRTAP